MLSGKTYPYPIPVSSRFCLKLPSKSPTVGKFCTPKNPMDSTCLRKLSIRRKGSVPHTPARTGTAFTTYVNIYSIYDGNYFKKVIKKLNLKEKHPLIHSSILSGRKANITMEEHAFPILTDVKGDKLDIFR